MVGSGTAGGWLSGAEGWSWAAKAADVILRVDRSEALAEIASE
jgi:hypothetical protein